MTNTTRISEFNIIEHRFEICGRRLPKPFSYVRCKCTVAASLSSVSTSISSKSLSNIGALDGLGWSSNRAKLYSRRSASFSVTLPISLLMFSVGGFLNFGIITSCSVLSIGFSITFIVHILRHLTNERNLSHHNLTFIKLFNYLAVHWEEFKRHLIWHTITAVSVFKIPALLLYRWRH